MKKSKKVKVKKLEDHLSENTWSLKKPMYIDKKDKRYKLYCKQLKKSGFSDTETWSLDDSISKFILPRLKRYREITISYPGFIEEVSTHEKWKEVLDKMIFSFEWNIMCEEPGYYELADEVKGENWKKYQEGLDLFAKYFRQLWW